jgi:hypothetical protein
LVRRHARKPSGHQGLDPDIVDVDIGQLIGRLGRRFYGIEI